MSIGAPDEINQEPTDEEVREFLGTYQIKIRSLLDGLTISGNEVQTWIAKDILKICRNNNLTLHPDAHECILIIDSSEPTTYEGIPSMKLKCRVVLFVTTGMESFEYSLFVPAGEFLEKGPIGEA